MSATRWPAALVPAALLLATALAPMLAGTATSQTAAPAPASDGIRFGIELLHVKEAREKGFEPTFGQYWAGTWTRWHWNDVDAAVARAKAQRVTPVIEWWYWGDQISPAFVERAPTGDDPRSLADWRDMSTTLAKKLHSGLDGAPSVVVLESEFNKNGIVGWAPWNTHLKDIVQIFRTHAPNAKLVLGYGDWDRTRWHLNAPVVEVVDGVGLQAMRGSTKQTESSYLAIGDSVLAGVTQMRKTFPAKDVWLHDIAFSSYPDETHRSIQAEGLRNLLSKRAELAAQGLVAMVYRFAWDDPHMGLHNYYGWAERYWGLMDRYGNPKPAWDVWVSMTSPASAAPPAAPVDVVGVASFASSSVERGHPLLGNLTLTNRGTQTVTLTDVTLAARPPGGTRNGGPYLDFGTEGTLTLAPGESVTRSFVRDFTEGDPLGQWVGYPVWRNPSGAWRDGPDARFEVTAPATPPPQDEPGSEAPPAPETETDPPAEPLPKPHMQGGRLRLPFPGGDVTLPVRGGTVVLR